MIKVKLLRPLDGKSEGETAEYTKLDAERLAKRRLVEVLNEGEPEGGENETSEEKTDAADEPEAKEAKAPDNKMEVEPANKAAPRSRKKGD